MPKVELLDLEGKKVKDIKLEDSIWDVKPNDQVLYESVILATASSRQGTSKTKTRSEVRGGGRKPWKQKGTGNARQGSIRAPQWTGGGIVFGPTPRSYSKKMNKKERRLALKTALTYKVKEKELKVIESIALESLKTKEFKKYLEKLNITNKVLIVCDELSDNLILATRNLRNIKVVLANEINTYDIMNYNNLLVTEKALGYIEEVLK